jgi:hypothetical protein
VLGSRPSRSGAPTRWPEPRAANTKRAKRLYALSTLLVAAGIIVYGAVAKPSGYWPYVIAAFLGGLLAIAELVSRYRDDPAGAVLSMPAAVYGVVNIAAAAVALYLLHVFNWTFGLTGTGRNVTQVLTAGFGSAALFRSSLFNVAIGDQFVGIGPSAVLNVILTAADREVDRRRADIRAADTAEIMAGFSFNKGAETLLKYCIATMQNLTSAEARAVESRIYELRDQKNKALPDAVKSYILGLELLTLVGKHVLTKASAQVKDALLVQEETLLQVVRRAGGTISVQQLRERAGLELSEIYSQLADLQERSLITLEGGPGNEAVKIIASGESPEPQTSEPPQNNATNRQTSAGLRGAAAKPPANTPTA